MAPKTDFPPIRACLFDNDGLLMDSEDIYSLATNIILDEFGKPELPWSIKAQLQGRPGPEAWSAFQGWAQLPIGAEEFDKKNVALQMKLFTRTKLLPGVMDLLTTLTKKTTPTVHIALATSSRTVTFNIKTNHLQEAFSMFPKDRRVLGDDPRIPKGKGKPAPDIYLIALQTINDGLASEGKEPPIKPEECLVFEDSVPGIESGRRAGMRVVWVPHPGLYSVYQDREKEVLAGYGVDYSPEEGKEAVEAAQDDIAGKEKRTGVKVKGAPGSVDDGWGQYLPNLVDFPYELYGIRVNERL